MTSLAIANVTDLVNCFHFVPLRSYGWKSVNLLCLETIYGPAPSEEPALVAFACIPLAKSYSCGCDIIMWQKKLDVFPPLALSCYRRHDTKRHTATSTSTASPSGPLSEPKYLKTADFVLLVWVRVPRCCTSLVQDSHEPFYKHIYSCITTLLAWSIFVWTENVIKDLGDLNIQVKCLNLTRTTSVLLRWQL